jgi:hypothetical protein
MEASIKGAKVVKVIRGRSELPRRLDKASLLMEAIWAKGVGDTHQPSARNEARASGTYAALLLRSLGN